MDSWIIQYIAVAVHDNEPLWELFADPSSQRTIIIGCLLLFVLFARPLTRFVNGLNVEKVVDNSVLLSYFTQGNGLEQMSEGVIKGLQYNLMMTTPLATIYGAPVTSPGVFIYRIELPFHTQAHILGVSTSFARSTALELRPELASNAMEKVNLEGDFGDFFALFAPKGQQVQTRYVFDPEAMVFAAKYFVGYHWEIVGDEMYLVGDPRTKEKRLESVILGHVNSFIDQIRPALVSQLGGHDLPGRAPYGEHRGKPMCCPVCTAALITEKHWFSCPNHHGRLIGGQELLAVRQRSIVSSAESGIAIPRTIQLQCPNCHSTMTTTDYQGMGIMIDSCSKCHYRWCDAGELSKTAM